MSVFDAILGLRRSEHRADMARQVDDDVEDAYTAALIAANRPQRQPPRPLPKVGEVPQ